MVQARPKDKRTRAIPLPAPLVTVDWEEWKEILGQAEIKDVRLHDARHTAGTLLGELHVDIHVIQRILGYAQVTTTRIYTDPTDPLTREAAELIFCKRRRSDTR